MLGQYKDFNVKHFNKTFNSSRYYDGDLNGFDVMIMQSHEDADILIEEIKKIIDTYKNPSQEDLNLEYDDNHLLEEDKIRVKKEIQKYISKILN